VVEEPGRRVVAEELAYGGNALPWEDMQAFARRTVEMALADREAVQKSAGWIFFDRGLIDASAALSHCKQEPLPDYLTIKYRYNRKVFSTPPWPEIFVEDDERRHSLSAAMAEYARLSQVYPSLGYDVTILPKISVLARADFVLTELGS